MRMNEMKWNASSFSSCCANSSSAKGLDRAKLLWTAAISNEASEPRTLSQALRVGEHGAAQLRVAQIGGKGVKVAELLAELDRRRARIHLARQVHNAVEQGQRRTGVGDRLQREPAALGRRIGPGGRIIDVLEEEDHGVDGRQMRERAGVERDQLTIQLRRIDARTPPRPAHP